MTNTEKVETIVIDGYTLRVLGNEAEIVNVNIGVIGTSEDIIVPEYVEDKKIISINKEAYADFRNVKNVHIPYSVELISNHAFNEIEQIHFYGDVESNKEKEVLIQSNAFSIRSKNVVIPLMIHYSNLEYYIEENDGALAYIVRDYDEEKAGWSLEELILTAHGTSVFIPQEGITEDMLKSYKCVKDENDEVAKLSSNIMEEELTLFEESGIFSFYHIVRIDNELKYSKVINNGFSYEYI